MNILLTGGAGYIGSVTANLLIDNGNKVIIIDNLINGDKKNIPKKSIFFKANITNKKILKKIFTNYKIDIVLHFAAFIDVAESVIKPEKYNKNNFKNSKIFFKICKENKIKKIVFSSTAAVYGNTMKGNVSESSKKKPLSPYAISKYNTEKFLIKSSYFKYIILRYFNVAGSDFKLRSGLISKKESTHLIKKICENYLNKQKLYIFGKDYPSKDGTAIRDFIHVMDLAEAHLKSCEYLNKFNKSNIFNCGYGKGYTVKEVIDCFNKISKKKYPFLIPKEELAICIN